MSYISKRLDQIIPKMEQDNFLIGSGLGNEVNIRIFDYDPKDEMIVRDKIKRIKNYFNRPESKLKIIEFDLYKMLIEMTKNEHIFDKVFEFEKEEGKKELFEVLVDFANSKYFIEKIIEDSKNYNTLLITGIGKVFPFVRSHSILNNLNVEIDGKPVILFFPGTYDTKSLNLFDKINDDNYYRAFQLVNRRRGK